MSRPIKTGSLYIVSEGEKTEASFYFDLQEVLKNAGCSCFTIVEIDKLPKPKELADTLSDVDLRPEGGRPLNNVNAVLPTDNYEPLNWIKKAYRKLGAFDEAWAVFDNDHRNNPPQGTPYIDLAIAEYHKLLSKDNNQSNINVAYSSLSFEYYLLQHFENLYHPFYKTECYRVVDERHKYLNCCNKVLHNPPLEGACDGLLQNDCCINGYARRHDYWQKSKTLGILSNINNIYIGIINSCRIRWKAFQLQSGSTIGNMNPFLNTYRLTLRMMGLQLLEYDQDIEIPMNGGSLVLHHEGYILRLFNHSNNTFLLSESYTPIFEVDSTQLLGKIDIGNLGRCLILNHQEETIDLSPLVGTDHFSILDINGHKVMVTFITVIPLVLSSQEKEQYKLTAE